MKLLNIQNYLHQVELLIFLDVQEVRSVLSLYLIVPQIESNNDDANTYTSVYFDNYL